MARYFICHALMACVMGEAGDGMPDGVFQPTPEKPLLNPKGLPSNSGGFFAVNFLKGDSVQQDDEIILRYAKEIAIKFIELGRISPGSFEEHFRSIFWSLKNTLVDARLPKLDEKAFGEDGAEDS